MQYKADFYAEYGNFMRERYLDFGFTSGTVQEVDFLEQLLQLPTGAPILDVGCGVGRHSLELARRGYLPFGIDISSGFIEVAQQIAHVENLKAQFQVADARNLALVDEFEVAICLCEGAFGLAGNEEDHRRILAGIYRALKPGGRFVLNALNALNIARNVTPQSVFDAYTATEMHKETITSPQGESKEVEMYTTAFTYRELKLLLEEAGFIVEAGYGCHAGKFEARPLTVNDYEIMMVAHRNS